MGYDIWSHLPGQFHPEKYAILTNLSHLCKIKNLMASSCLTILQSQGYCRHWEKKINKLRSPKDCVCAYRKLKCHLMPVSQLFALPPDPRIPTYSNKVLKNLLEIYFLKRLQRSVAQKYLPPGQVSEMNEQDKCILRI